MNWLGMGIGFGIVFGGTTLGLAWQARRRGDLLLDTGPLEVPLLSRNPVTYLPVAIVLAYAWFRSRTVGVVMMTIALGGMLAVLVVLKKRTRLRFTDQGICFLGFIQWSEIRSYRWEQNPKGDDVLVIEAWRRGRNATISYPIPLIFHGRVADILAAHVHDGGSGGSR